MTDKPRLGIYENLDEQAYHEDDALGSNDIKGLIKTKGLYNKKKYAPDSDSLRIGSAFHCLFLLGKNEFLKQYKIRKAPRVQRFWGNGKTIVSLSEFQMISDWCRNIPKSIINLRGEECTARNIMDSGAIKSVKTELSYFWINEQGVRCKVRFDMLFNDNIIVDPKTIQNWKGIDMDLCINESIAKLTSRQSNI